MTAVAPTPGGGQIVLEVGVQGAGDVRLSVGAASPAWIGQVGSAIDDRPRGVPEVGSQILLCDQGGWVGHTASRGRRQYRMGHRHVNLERAGPASSVAAKSCSIGPPRAAMECNGDVF